MSREHLYKAKRKNWRRLPKEEWWIEGYYAVIGNKPVIIKAEHEDFYSVEKNINKSHGNEVIEVDPETVCQYTGLTDETKWEELSENEKEKFLSEWNYKENRRNTKKDWNGRKIFEGDIVRDIFNASVVGIVRYGEYRNTFNDDEYGGHVGFYVEWKEKQDFLRKDLVYWVKNSEFIGNIFDNPELINGGKEK